MHQITSAMESCYDDAACQAEGAYLSQATMPTGIGTYLATVSTDPGTGSPAYTWIDNSSTNQDYCIYAILEKAASAGQVAIMTAGPEGVGEKEVADADENGVPDAGTVTLANCE